MRFIKFVKLIGYSYACNSLTCFEFKLNAMTGNGNYVNLLQLVWKNSWIHLKWAYFWRVLALWNYCVTDQTTTRLSCLVLTWSSSRNQLAYVALSLWGRRAGTVHRLSLRKLKIKMNALVRARAVNSGGTVSRLDWSNSRLCLPE